MGTLQFIPFRSYHTLHKWFNESSRDEMSVQYMEGMRYWFAQEAQPTIRIYDYGEGPHPESLDIQMEFIIGGEIEQIYLMTLVTEKSTDESIYLNDMTTPFYTNPIIWPRTTLGKEETLEAVEAWSRRWWPDFSCCYSFGPAWVQSEEPAHEK